MTYKISGFIACAAFFIAMSFGQAVNGQITITSTSTVGIGSSEFVNFTASGVDPVNVLTLATAINQNTGTDPDIVDVVGLGFFGGVTPTFAGGAAGLPANSPQATVALFNSASTGVIDGQEFAAVELDTTGLSVGDVFDIDLAIGPSSTVFADGATAVDANFPSSFQITVVGAAIPEPSSVVLLLATGGLALVRRKRV